MANFGIFDDDNLFLEDGNSALLLVDGTTPLSIFGASAVRDQRQFPDDGLRYHPTPIDLIRLWPDI